LGSVAQRRSVRVLMNCFPVLLDHHGIEEEIPLHLSLGISLWPPSAKQAGSLQCFFHLTLLCSESRSHEIMPCHAVHITC